MTKSYLALAVNAVLSLGFAAAVTLTLVYSFFQIS